LKESKFARAFRHGPLPFFDSVFQKPALYQGTTLQLAEKRKRSSKKRQGTTLVVPQMRQNQRGL
jgi:hypothetical protein